MKKSDYTIEINGKEFELQEEVFNLIHNVSKEKDGYKEALCSIRSNADEFTNKNVLTYYIDNVIAFQNAQQSYNNSIIEKDELSIVIDDKKTDWLIEDLTTVVKRSRSENIPISPLMLSVLEKLQNKKQPMFWSLKECFIMDGFVEGAYKETNDKYFLEVQNVITTAVETWEKSQIHNN